MSLQTGARQYASALLGKEMPSREKLNNVAAVLKTCANGIDRLKEDLAKMTDMKWFAE